MFRTADIYFAEHEVSTDNSIMPVTEIEDRRYTVQ